MDLDAAGLRGRLPGADAEGEVEVAAVPVLVAEGDFEGAAPEARGGGAAGGGGEVDVLEVAGDWLVQCIAYGKVVTERYF